MRICILTSVHTAFDPRIFHKQAKTLAKAGYHVTLIAQHDKDEVVEGINIIAMPIPRNRSWRMLSTWRMFGLAHQQKADVYHFHDPELLPAGLLLKLLTKKPVIYDVHEDYPGAILTKQWLPPPVRKPLSRLFNLLGQSAASQLDYIVVATDHIATKFKSTDKVATIKNYPILEKNAPGTRGEPGRPTLIYIGVLSEIRGISDIVQAMSYLAHSRNASLILCGKFYPAGYEETVRGLKGSDSVEYRGIVKPEVAGQQLGQATIGIVCFHPEPNHVNAMPNKLFEYMAAELPVIASNFPLWKGIVEGNSCGLTVNPLDPAEIAGAIEYLLDHPDEARQMGENGRRAVQEKYNWDSEGKKLLELYERVSGGTS